MDMHAANIRVAEYIAHLPELEKLQEQLHRAVKIAQERSLLIERQ